MDKIKYLVRLATSFRNAIERLEAHEVPSSEFLLGYPEGCCGDASNLLSKYLSENGIRAEYVYGMLNEQSHAWLEFEDYIIDITADQFTDINQKIIVTKDRSWHNKFKGQARHFNDFEEFEPYHKDRLSIIYRNILKKLETNN